MGDAGHPGSYHLPARVRVVTGADSPEIVRDGVPPPELAERFVAAARELEAEGAVMLTSTCGFLVSMQERIAQAVAIPVLLSGLSLVPLARALTGNRPVGVLTASAASLGPRSLAAAGTAPDEVRIAGLDGFAEFASVFLRPRDEQAGSFDPARMGALVVETGRALTARHPDIGAIVLECGNLPPYGAALRRALKRPVLGILDGARMLAG
ncbi:aspartate/glutamate racemase family protein [Paracoccus sp. S-4012]|uniref:aspartate/glutamate racemase family protein n=1 Tax=Paracoccus sp. S-4012 TaxID=2665648 RepID=UPI0012AFF050|nr:aspartate/glutamate racemase family protein [Paracoccus sp. S-4012]MRX50545.1 aspartate/glutamate racemase family protein [Paracoccus sp. S-4012]